MSESSNVQGRKHERNQRASVSKAEARSALITVFLDDLLEGGGTTVEPFRTPDGEPFARIQVDEHWELFSLETRKTSPLKLWIRRAFWQRDRGILKPSELTEIIDRLDAAARFGDHVARVARRVAEYGGHFYLQLDKARTVEIGADGWRVVTDPPVRFLWHEGMIALPAPTRGGDLNHLIDLVNIRSRDHQILSLTWLLMAMTPGGPFPILALHGPQGTAKTSTARIFLDLVDPSRGNVNSRPPTERDLMIRLSKSHVVAFDNLSEMPGWLSDALCRISTGAGYVRRLLYTDDSEVFFGGRHPILFNGIPDLAERADLLDRMITLHLPRIPESQRRLEREMETRFEELRPQIMGALFDALAITIRNLPTVQLSTLPRMADFARFGCAAETALGFESGEFLAAYACHIGETNWAALDNNPFALALLNWHIDEFVGTMREVLRHVDANNSKDPLWPKSPRAAAAALRRAESNLLAAGVQEITHLPREAGTGRRLIRFRNPATNVSQQEKIVTAKPSDCQAVADNCDDVTKSEQINSVRQMKPADVTSVPQTEWEL